MSRALAFLTIVTVAIGCGGNSSGGSAGNGPTGGTGTNGGSGVTGGTVGTGTGGSPTPVGTLWVGGSGSLSASALLDAGATPPFGQTCIPTGYTSTNPIDGAAVVDGKGNLWSQFPDGTVGGFTSAPIYEWNASQLGSCSSNPPAATFSLTNLVYAGGDGSDVNPFFVQLAFDSDGNLWGAEAASSSIFEYRASDLAAGTSSLTAAVVVPPQVCGPLEVLCSPAGLAFDAAGNLWISNGYSVIAYTPSTLAAILGGDAGSPAADLLLTTSAAETFDAGDHEVFYSHYTFGALAFDRSGNLWVAVDNLQGTVEQQIVEFSKAQLSALATDNTPTPVLTVTETAAQKSNLFLGWGSLAFDADGNLWGGTSGFTPNLYRFSAASLANGGLPDVGLTVVGDSSFSLVFDPIPAGLPLRP